MSNKATMIPMSTRRTPRLRYQLALFTLTRTLVNTGYRLVYPFQPAIARGLGVGTEAVALAITLRSGFGLLGPLFGALVDALGRKTAMLIGLGVVIGGLLLLSALPVYAVLVIALLLIGAGKMVLDPAIQAYVGDRVPYAQRGLAIGITEVGWSLAFLLGIPAAAWLIERESWNTPFPFLAGLVLAVTVLLWRRLPSDRQRPDPVAGKRPPLLTRHTLRTIFTQRAALAGLLVSLFICGANETVAIVFGVWLEDAFLLQVTALGTASMVIGLAELGGEGLVVTLTDRIGIRRAAALGIGGSVLTSLLLPVLGTTLVGAEAGLFLFFLSFEFTLVTSIALMTEVAASETRATLLASNIAFMSIGRMVGAPLGTAIFAGSMAFNGIAAAAFYAVALLILLAFVRVDAPRPTSG